MTRLMDKFLNATMGSIFGSQQVIPSSEFANRLGTYSQLTSYQKIFEVNKLKRPISTNKTIAYSKKLIFGSSKEQVKALLKSTPVEALFNTHNLNRNILLFTEKHGEHQVLIEAHFHNNQLFFFKFMFPEASPELRTTMIKELIAEYSLPNVDLTLHSVYDSNNNCIQVRDLNTFEILYTNLKNPFFDQLVKAISKTNNQLIADYQLTSAPILGKIKTS